LITNAVDLGTVLGIWAHPDDEAFLSAGLMAAARDAGQRVVCVTATLGEHGTDDPQRWPPQRLAKVRAHEARASLAALGVTEHHLLGIGDGTCAAQPHDVVVRRLAEIIEGAGPDTIVTFGPDGMTGHQDHRAISAWVTEAWGRSGCRGDLWYATLTPEFHADWGHLNDEVGLWFEGSTPPVTARADLAAEVRLSGWQLRRKQQALRAHATQTRPLEDLVGAERYRAWWATESFVAAERHPSVATGASAGRASISSCG
jgi:LmbE family N-acetylglucosaminyl deacetylase